jgi:hypothetical protein
MLFVIKNPKPGVIVKHGIRFNPARMPEQKGKRQ